MQAEAGNADCKIDQNKRLQDSDCDLVKRKTLFIIADILICFPFCGQDMAAVVYFIYYVYG